jgi:hypothetical protein
MFASFKLSAFGSLYTLPVENRHETDVGRALPQNGRVHPTSNHPFHLSQ